MRGKFHYLQGHALHMLQLAIKHGDLTPLLICEKCGESHSDRPLDGHHTDYSKPLEVIWLCRSCHLKEHHFKERRTTNPRVKIHEVVARVRENGDHGLSTTEMMEKYGISAGATSTIRKQLVNGNGNGHHA